MSDEWTEKHERLEQVIGEHVISTDRVIEAATALGILADEGVDIFTLIKFYCLNMKQERWLRKPEIMAIINDESVGGGVFFHTAPMVYTAGIRRNDNEAG